MFGFIFSFIRAMTSEVKTAHVAQYIEDNITRNHFTFWLVDSASLWLYRHTAFRFCVRCGEFVIDESYSDIHPSCLAELESELDAERAEYEASLDEEDVEPDEIYHFYDEYEQEDPFEDKGYGLCLRCKHGLLESEGAISDYCDSCRPVFLEEWEAQQEAQAEAAEEARRYPEVSDDDYFDDSLPPWLR